MYNILPNPRAVYEIMWKKNLRFECWITKAANTQSEYLGSYSLLFHGNNDRRRRLNVALFVHCAVLFESQFSVTVLPKGTAMEESEPYYKRFE
jgi:hypothetical protein